jgi:hypothetical protein
MALFKYKLPNGNVFIWLATSEGIDNLLVLEGGDVLILKTTTVVSLNKEEVKEDIKLLSFEEFVEKYELPSNVELWDELKRGVKMGNYPPFLEKPNEKIMEFRGMISAYIFNILQLKDPNEKIRQLEAIIGDCHRKILEIKSQIRQTK